MEVVIRLESVDSRCKKVLLDGKTLGTLFCESRPDEPRHWVFYGEHGVPIEHWDLDEIADLIRRLNVEDWFDD